FSYSARPGTGAATLPDQVPPPIIKQRSARVRALGSDLSLRFRAGQVGRVLPVLTLREVRADGRLRALSDSFIDLGLDTGGRPPEPLFNRLLADRVTAASAQYTLAVMALRRGSLPSAAVDEVLAEGVEQVPLVAGPQGGEVNEV